MESLGTPGLEPYAGQAPLSEVAVPLRAARKSIPRNFICGLEHGWAGCDSERRRHPEDARRSRSPKSAIRQVARGDCPLSAISGSWGLAPVDGH